MWSLIFLYSDPAIVLLSRGQVTSLTVSLFLVVAHFIFMPNSKFLWNYKRRAQTRFPVFKGSKDVNEERAGKGPSKFCSRLPFRVKDKGTPDTEISPFKPGKCFPISCLGFPNSKMKGLDFVKGKLCIYMNISLGSIKTVLFHHN